MQFDARVDESGGGVGADGRGAQSGDDAGLGVGQQVAGVRLLGQGRDGRSGEVRVDLLTAPAGRGGYRAAGGGGLGWER